MRNFLDGYVEFLITHWKFCTVHLSLINHHMIQYVWSMFLMFALVTETCLCTGALFLDWWTRRLLVVCRSFWVLEGLTVTFPWCNSLPCLLSSLYWDFTPKGRSGRFVQEVLQFFMLEWICHRYKLLFCKFHWEIVDWRYLNVQSSQHVDFHMFCLIWTLMLLCSDLRETCVSGCHTSWARDYITITAHSNNVPY